MSDCFICVNNHSLKVDGSSKIRANATLSNVLSGRLGGVAKINPNKIQQPALLKGKFSGSGKILGKPKLSHNLRAFGAVEIVDIKAHLVVNGVARSRLSSSININDLYADKFGGNIDGLNDIDNFASVQKLYPIRDITTSLNNSYFVNKNLSSGNLYQSIDEGIFTGNYNQNLK